ncbi:MAG: hypothetical protein LKF65_07365, partial [Lactobacillus delbrueckii]|nr:hypothetical protein [Lactobacillus delbrueckii]
SREKLHCISVHGSHEKTAEWQVGKKEKKEKLKNAPMGRFCVLDSCLKTRVCAHFLIKNRMISQLFRS